jgi:hypothetical protein
MTKLFVPNSLSFVGAQPKLSQEESLVRSLALLSLVPLQKPVGSAMRC